MDYVQPGKFIMEWSLLPTQMCECRLWRHPHFFSACGSLVMRNVPPHSHPCNALIYNTGHASLGSHRRGKCGRKRDDVIVDMRV